MIRKDHDCFDRERTLATCRAKSVSQGGDMIDKSTRMTVSEREHSSSEEISSISGHSGVPGVASLTRATLLH
jgi:hypothetical protein